MKKTLVLSVLLAIVIALALTCKPDPVITEEPIKHRVAPDRPIKIDSLKVYPWPLNQK